MSPLSTEDVARLVGVHRATVERWIKEKRISRPKPLLYGRQSLRLWTDEDIRRLREYKAAHYNKKPRRKKAKAGKKTRRSRP